MIKKIVLLLLVGLVALNGFGQQDPQYSLYMFNPLGVNPGYAGSREVLSAVLVHRSQWVGIEGAPETQALAINTPFKNKRMGVGMQVINDKIGPRTTQYASASYAYRLKLGTGRLAMGLRAGVINYNYNWDEITYKDQADAIPQNGIDNFMLPSFDFGLYYHTKTFYMGASADHINQSKFNLIAQQDSIFSTATQYSNFIGTIGKAFILNDNFVLKTSMLVRAANTGGNLDLNVSTLISNSVLFGLSLRSTQAVILMTEFNLSKNLRLGLAYDFDTTDLAQGGSGSFEVFLGYDLGLFRSKVLSPRYF